ncbi:tRNA (adenine-N1)-methyltransferase [Caldisericum exile]|uniref:tRNA (adenine(58)-N(1))-methyltransferase TrmI n=1 Tax=Caldisericum exile (strain DSM 21853 / NBRC 104410 / AZM16c01) TaxID=511051 RepID=A0A7U6GDF9_CALEA|nr:methyltransferase [Caldisericum exile]BAL80385.1 putative methyltransferase [Caldisericum exile AZM16c01]
MGNRFKEGDLVEVIDSKDRIFLLKLKKGEKSHFHFGILEHDSIIGKVNGSFVKSLKGDEVLVFKVRTPFYTVHMRRVSQIIYPKDVGAIVIHADIHPGLRVFTAGGGAGALAISLLQMLHGRGKLIVYEIRSDFIDVFLANVYDFFKEIPKNLIIRRKDIYAEPVEENDAPFDRVILDVPEPWRALKTVKDALVPGGILISYSPTTQQITEMKQALDDSKEFYNLGTFEIIERRWKVEALSTRPVDRMVAHTAFILVARKLSKKKP